MVKKIHWQIVRTLILIDILFVNQSFYKSLITWKKIKKKNCEINLRKQNSFYCRSFMFLLIYSISYSIIKQFQPITFFF